MDKLVKLLNQYEKERLVKIGCEVDEDIEYYGRSLENGKIVNRNYDRDVHSFLKYYIISKDYEFIKWLIENDKINWWRIENNQDYAEYLGSSLPIEEYGVEILLMLLAIADEPIDYLCCIIRQF